MDDEQRQDTSERTEKTTTQPDGTEITERTEKTADAPGTRDEPVRPGESADSGVL